jgi:hypothetical protein
MQWNTQFSFGWGNSVWWAGTFWTHEAHKVPEKQEYFKTETVKIAADISHVTFHALWTGTQEQL